MSFQRQGDGTIGTGNVVSPGGFEFGVVGWHPGDPRPKSITFFLDGSAMVCDQHGTPIKGVVIDNKTMWFAVTPPRCDVEAPLSYQRRSIVVNKQQVPLATHAEVIKALEHERVDWTKLTWAGTPQLPYEQLKKLTTLHTASIEELRRIPDPALRKDALRVRREWEEQRRAEAEGIAAE